MKRTKTYLLACTVLAAAALAILVPRAAEARSDGRDFGIGIIAGGPTGLSMEVSLGYNTALDFAVGFDTFDDNQAYLHMDYLVMPFNLSRGGSVSVPLYLGIGGFLQDHGSDFDVSDVGLRIPFGFSLDFRRVPLQFFAELAFNVVLVTVDHDHGRDTDLDGALGFRFFF